MTFHPFCFPEFPFSLFPALSFELLLFFYFAVPMARSTSRFPTRHQERLVFLLFWSLCSSIRPQGFPFLASITRRALLPSIASFPAISTPLHLPHVTVSFWSISSLPRLVFIDQNHRTDRPSGFLCLPSSLPVMCCLSESSAVCRPVCRDVMNVRI